MFLGKKGASINDVQTQGGGGVSRITPNMRTNSIDFVVKKSRNVADVMYGSPLRKNEAVFSIPVPCRRNIAFRR